jgi:hypothetical protein
MWEQEFIMAQVWGYGTVENKSTPVFLEIAFHSGGRREKEEFCECYFYKYLANQKIASKKESLESKIKKLVDFVSNGLWSCCRGDIVVRLNGKEVIRKGYTGRLYTPPWDL